MTQERTFRWGKGLLHGLMLMLVAVLSMAVVVGLVKVGNPRKLGEVYGRFAIFTFLIGLAISYGFQTGKRWLGWALSALALLLIVGVPLIGILLRGKKSAERRLSGAEKLPLTVVQHRGVKRLWHPSLGFSVAHPGPEFKKLPATTFPLISRAMGPGAIVHLYVKQKSGTGFAVGLMKRASNRELAQGFQRGFVKRALKTLGKRAQLVENRLLWEPKRKLLRIHLMIDLQLHLLLETHFGVLSDKRWAVMLMISGSNLKSLQALLRSFRPGP